MRTGTTSSRRGVVLLVVAGLIGCQPRSTPAPSGSASTAVKKPTREEARKALAEATERDRTKYQGMTFEAFKASPAVYLEPFPGGKYIVDGDTTIANEKKLREFFEQKVKVAPPPPPPPTALIVVRNGVDAVWNQEMKRKLSYCVSRTDFADKYDAVVRDMENATSAWEQVAQVDFTHDATQDGQCTAANTSVLFDVRPVTGPRYAARAFFPNEPRADSNVLINTNQLGLPADEKPQLVGILRHELGHSLGFRHEHTRPSSGACFEDSDWTELTQYDPFSVMHYPQCNGLGDWSLVLTDFDRNGVACLYGAKAPFVIDPGLVLDASSCSKDLPAPAGTAKTQSFDGQTVAKDAEKQYGPFAVIAGSLFDATIFGSDATGGDPDLYVRFGAQPKVDRYDCRPYRVGPNETCAVNVPTNMTQVNVMVRGYAAGNFGLRVKHVPPSH